MKWEKPITADGHTATPEQLQAAWEAWQAEGCKLTTVGLVNCLIEAGGEWSWWAIGYQMIQKARKAGAIRFAKGRWELGKPGEAAR